MPEQFDEAWEYYTPDPEIEYCVYGRQPSAFEAITDGRQQYKFQGEGIRFGRGNPDRFWGRLAKPRHTQRDRVVESPALFCGACGVLFRAKHRAQRYCSRQCGRPRRLEDRECATCGVVFRPRVAVQVYCSLKCVPHPGPSRRLEDRECAACGVVFRPRVLVQIFCSHRCSPHFGRVGKAADKKCASCGVLFRPDRRRRRYCGMGCVPRPGRLRVLGDRTCIACGSDFRPRHEKQARCSLSCAAARRRKASGVDRDEFRKRYLRGDRVEDIAAALRVTVGHCKKLRRKLGITPRPPGNHRRGPGVAAGVGGE